MSDRDILRDEDGIALTEYLALAGLLVGAVIVAVFTFGSAMSDKWESWSRFTTTLVPEQSVAGEAEVLAAAKVKAKGEKDRDTSSQCVGRSNGACTASDNHD